MKYIGLIFFAIVILNNSVTCQELQNEPFIQKLINNTWGDLKISINEDNSLSYFITGRSSTAKWDEEHGKIQVDIINKEITFKIEYPENKKNKTYKLKYRESNQDILYTEFIGDYPNINSKVEAGSIRYYDKIKIEIIDEKLLRTDYNVFFREKPSKYSDYYEIISPSRKEPIIFLTNEDMLYSVKVIAKTYDKYAVDDTNNYWYLIKIILPIFSPSDKIKLHLKSEFIENSNYLVSTFAWVYGEYIELVDK